MKLRQKMKYQTKPSSRSRDNKAEVNGNFHTLSLFENNWLPVSPHFRPCYQFFLVHYCFTVHHCAELTCNLQHVTIFTSASTRLPKPFAFNSRLWSPKGCNHCFMHVIFLELCRTFARDRGCPCLSEGPEEGIGLEPSVNERRAGWHVTSAPKSRLILATVRYINRLPLAPSMEPVWSVASRYCCMRTGIFHFAQSWGWQACTSYSRGDRPIHPLKIGDP
jgi:hypothetical protein